MYTSPKILASFGDARQIFKARRRPDVVAVPAYGPSPSRESVSWRALVFPGWEQVHQQRDTKGYVLIGAGAVALGASIALEIERSNARSEYLAAVSPDQAVARYDRYNRAHKTEIYAILSFAVIYIYSEVDAFLNLPQTDVVSLQPTPGGVQLAIRF